ncbi:MAG: hypothetical protein KC474_09055 [Cyanobacteria bacterium HKST-UBA04]|nr:hypothetical protein [Cyanobacteria bacterium HKST-UBA04]
MYRVSSPAQWLLNKLSSSGRSVPTAGVKTDKVDKADKAGQTGQTQRPADADTSRYKTPAGGMNTGFISGFNRDGSLRQKPDMSQSTYEINDGNQADRQESSRPKSTEKGPGGGGHSPRGPGASTLPWGPPALNPLRHGPANPANSASANPFLSK